MNACPTLDSAHQQPLTSLLPAGRFFLSTHRLIRAMNMLNLCNADLRFKVKAILSSTRRESIGHQCHSQRVAVLQMVDEAGIHKRIGRAENIF